MCASGAGLTLGRGRGQGTRIELDRGQGAVQGALLWSPAWKAAWSHTDLRLNSGSTVYSLGDFGQIVRISLV